MGTIADKLNRVLESKSQIKDALISKGVEIPDDTPFRSYPSLVDNIQTGAELNIAFGDEAPEDTTKLWVESEEKNDICLLSNDRQLVLEGTYERLTEAAYGIGTAAVGTKIYLFGGYGETCLDTISVFDTVTERVTTLATKLPAAAYSIGTAAVGTKIYLFGGLGYASTRYNLDTISVFDTETESITKLAVKLPTAAYCIGTTAVGTKIYLFGGLCYASTKNSLDTICVFDTESRSITKLSTTLPGACGNMGVASVGSKIYLFGGTIYSATARNTIWAFDSSTETITTCTASLPVPNGGLSATAVDSKIYLFGGYDNDCLHTIYSFDAVEETLARSSTTLQHKARYIGVSSIGSKIYLFGGSTTSLTFDTIYVFDTASKLDNYIESYNVTTCSAALSEARSSIQPARVGAKAYIFGGGGYAISERKTIDVFDIETETLTTIDTVLSTAASGIGTAAVGTKIYLFGGYGDSYLDTISVFDTETETLVTLDTVLPTAACDIGTAAVGTKIYLFGGYMRSYLDTINVFDTETETLTTLDAVLPTTFGSVRTVAIGNNIYVFESNAGYYGPCSINIFNADIDDFIGESIDVPTSPDKINRLSSGVVSSGSIIYGLGYHDKLSGVYSIYVFDPATNELRVCPTTLGGPISSCGICATDSTIYIFGGYYRYNNSVYNTIRKLDLTPNVVNAPMYEINTPAAEYFYSDDLVLCDGSPSHPVTLLNTGDITLQIAVNSVYKGNSDGTCTKVPAHVYENGEWVEI